MTNPNHTDTNRSGDLVKMLADAVFTGTGVMKDGKHVPIEDFYLDPRDARIEALEAENERLREVLEVVWKEATTMRNASKLVGPYPKEPANNRVWARSMYHAGKKLHELIKPVRTALGEKQ